MKALIFAAGLGTRLRPLTDHRPKALVEVNGKTMLQRVIENVKRAGVTHAVVNVHHFAPMVVDYLQQNQNFGIDIQVSDESSCLLDTGGGLLHAQSLLDGDEPILLHNADILTDIDLTQLQLKGDATLLVQTRRSSRQLVFSPDEMRLHGWINLDTGETKGYVGSDGVQRAFGGIHMVSPRIFAELAQYAAKVGSDVFSITPFYVASAAKLKIYGQEISTPYRWFDIGKPASLAQAEESGL
jgi:NDP-sugar pyrophosphorylase family protein